MSIKAINWALNLPLTSTQKLVLLVLANCANEDNIAFPSTAYLVRTTGLTDRAIRSARKALRELGLISPLHGRATVLLHLEEASPNRNPLPPTRTHVPPNRNPLPPPREPTRTQKEPTPHPPKAPSPLTTLPQKLPPNWQPTPELRAFAQDQGCDPPAIAAAFCAYWHEATGPKALKTDWNQAWKAWCRRQKNRPSNRSAATPRPPLNLRACDLQALDTLAATPESWKPEPGKQKNIA